MWNQFKTAVLQSACREVCGAECIGCGNGGTAWWNEDLWMLVEKKKRLEGEAKSARKC